jgi:hypothetical protein
MTPTIPIGLPFDCAPGGDFPQIMASPYRVIYDSTAVSQRGNIFPTFDRALLNASLFQGPVSIYIANSSVVPAGNYTTPTSWYLETDSHGATFADQVYFSTSPIAISPEGHATLTFQEASGGSTFTLTNPLMSIVGAVVVLGTSGALIDGTSNENLTLEDTQVTSSGQTLMTGTSNTVQALGQSTIQNNLLPASMTIEFDDLSSVGSQNGNTGVELNGGGGGTPIPLHEIAVGTGPSITGFADFTFDDTSKVLGLAGGRIQIGNAVTAPVAGVAIGNSSTATIGGDVAIGDANAASGGGAVSIGEGNTATGIGAVAIGNGPTATGIAAVAIGATLADGQGSVAIGNCRAGFDSTTTGHVALGFTASAGITTPSLVGIVAIGDTVTADGGSGAVVIGSASTAAGAGAAAIGNGAAASGTGSAAIGNGSSASGVGAAAIGNGNSATAEASLATGESGIASNYGQRSHAAGTTSTTKVQLSDVAMVGSTPGLGLGEASILTLCDGATAGIPLTGVSQTFRVSVTMFTTAGGIPSQTFEQSANVAGGVLQAVSTPQVTFGSAGGATWTMVLSAAAGMFVITMTTGSTTTATSIMARVEFEDFNL